jgi:hypothetical protein
MKYVTGFFRFWYDFPTDYPFTPDNPRPELHLGDSAMVFVGLEIYDGVPSEGTVTAGS